LSMKIEFTSPPDREGLVVSLLWDSEQWAEVNNDGGRLTVEFYARRSGHPWIFDYEEAIGALLEAERRLAEGRH
jgi:hypothetical protein